MDDLILIWRGKVAELREAVAKEKAAVAKAKETEVLLKKYALRNKTQCDKKVRQAKTTCSLSLAEALETRAVPVDRSSEITLNYVDLIVADACLCCP